MKLLSFLAVFVLFCSSYAYVSHLAEYEASLKIWKNLRPSTYTYSPFYKHYTIDYDITTAITVTDGKVVKRTFTAPNEEIETDEPYTWTEGPDSIGTHSEGWIPITLDDVYKQCRDNVLVHDNTAYPVVFNTVPWQ